MINKSEPYFVLWDYIEGKGRVLTHKEWESKSKVLSPIRQKYKRVYSLDEAQALARKPQRITPAVRCLPKFYLEYDGEGSYYLRSVDNNPSLKSGYDSATHALRLLDIESIIKADRTLKFRDITSFLSLLDKNLLSQIPCFILTKDIDLVRKSQDKYSNIKVVLY